MAQTNAVPEKWRLGDDFALESLGPQTLKNVAEPVQAWRVLGRDAPRIDQAHAGRSAESPQ